MSAPSSAFRSASTDQGYSDAAVRAGLTDPAIRARRRRTAFWPVAEDMLRVYWRYRVTLLTGALGEPLIFLLGMGLGLGALVSQGTGADTYGVDYVTFVAPALMLSAAVMVGVEEATYQVLGGTQWESKRYYSVYQAAVSPGQLSLGAMLAMQIRVLVVAVIYYLAMLAFGVMPHPVRGMAMIPVAVLAAWAFSAPVAGYFAGLAKEGGKSNLVRRFLVMPLVLFAGTYYPLGVLPIGLQWIGWLSPIWHGTQLARGLSFGYAEPVWLVAAHAAYLVLLGAAGMFWLWRNLTRKLGEQ